MVDKMKLTREMRRALIYCWLWNKPIRIPNIRAHTALFTVVDYKAFPRIAFTFRNPYVLETIEKELNSNPSARAEYDQLTSITIEKLRKVFSYIKDIFEESK